MSVNANQLAQSGFAFLGRSYKEMDCQEFIERCLSVCGMKINLRGSNAWYRKMTWTGSPEECRRLLGAVPAGAFLFIWADDGGEVQRGYHDGLGNASHIGICTGTGKGAVHSSETRDCVAESIFAGKSIPGGWNRVGLWNQISYDSKTDEFLASLKPSASDPVHKEGVKTRMEYYQARVIGDGALNMRSKPDRGAARITQLAVGTIVTVTNESGEWSRINSGGRTGYVMSEYLERVSDENTEEMIPVPKKRLLTFYNELGGMLDRG